MKSQKNGEQGRSPIHNNYRDFQASALKDQELRRQMAAKALDLPYDTMGNISVENHHHHYSPEKNSFGKVARVALLGASLLGTGGLGGLAAWWLTRPTPAVQPSTDTRIELGVFSE